MDEQRDNCQKDMTAVLCEEDRQMLSEINEKADYLTDLFVRRLKDDRQKTEMIETLTKQAEYNYIEPFLHDLILLLDRLEKASDDFSASVYEELSDILFRNGVQRIDVSGEFDPAIHKVVRTIESEEGHSSQIAEVIRSGYLYNGTVVRPAEIVMFM